MDKYLVPIDKAASSKWPAAKKKSAKQAKLTDMPGVTVGDKTSDFVRQKSSGHVYHKQSRLFELKGVVVLEKLEEFKDKLSSSEIGPDEKLQILDELLNKQPSTKIIQSTKIGKVIRKLSDGSIQANEEVIAKASELYDKWKTMVEKRVELSSIKMSESKRAELEVAYDAETNRKREKSVEFLQEIVRTTISESAVFPRQEKVLRQIERFVFEQISKKLLNARYNRTMRKIIFCLRHNDDIRQKVLVEKSKSVEAFVRDLCK